MSEQSGREQKVYGRKACWAVFARRPHDIVRIYHAASVRREVGPILKWAAAARIPYRELDEEGLRRVSGATHHEGLAMTVRPLEYLPWEVSGPVDDAVWVALDGVGNPYNLGAILRSCAFFGVEAVLVSGVSAGERVNGAAIRTAEGGAEEVRLIAAEPLAPVLHELREPVPVIGLESDAALALTAAPTGLPCVLVVGHEREGLSAAVREACTAVCSIPGAGSVGSLNVSVAAGIALAELFRAPSPAPRSPPATQAIRVVKPRRRRGR